MCDSWFSILPVKEPFECQSVRASISVLSPSFSHPGCLLCRRHALVSCLANSFQWSQLSSPVKVKHMQYIGWKHSKSTSGDRLLKKKLAVWVVNINNHCCRWYDIMAVPPSPLWQIVPLPSTCKCLIDWIFQAFQCVILWLLVLFYE